MPITLTVVTSDSLGDTASVLSSDRSVKLSNDSSALEPVMRVASRVVFAGDRWAYRRLPFDWTVAVLEEEGTQRILVRPSGSIVVHRATFRLAETEAGLAALLSHELAHLVADHHPDGLKTGTETEKVALYSRAQELEADAIGMMIMADAGYDPGEMLRMWERLKRAHAVNDGLLTHLTYDRRLQELTGRLPEALGRYVKSNRAPQRSLPLK